MTGVDFIYHQEVKIIMIRITTVLTIANSIILSSYLYKLGILYLYFLKD